MVPDLNTGTVVRTLIAAGFTITNSHRQPMHIEIACQRPDMFGVVVNYLIVVCDGNEPPAKDLKNIQREASGSGRVPILVAKGFGPDWLSWQEFLDSLGGAVPSWRALSAQFEDVLITSGKNSLPPGLQGEAWQIFEDAVADGLEFLLGHRVNRLGGRKRGKRVSDMLAQTPNQEILLLDAKASKNHFDVTWPELRPLVEYTKGQVQRQRGQDSVRASLLVADDYVQDATTLASVSGEFLSETSIPLSFLRSRDLAFLVRVFAAEPLLRSAISWKRVFCKGGSITRSSIDAEVDAARTGRYARNEPLSS